MQKDCCSPGSGLCKWCCPTVLGVVAGLIVFSAGAMKFVGGQDTLTAVGNMALGIVGVNGYPQLALILGTIAAAIEVLGGISFAVGCRKTSKWAALALAFVFAVALLFKLTHLRPLSGNALIKTAGVLEQTRLELLLFAVFFQRAMKLLMGWCGMGGSCCSMKDMPRK